MGADEMEDYLELQDPKVREHIHRSHDEFLAGTDWLDPNSVLRITSLTRIVSGQMVLQFASVTSKSYVIEYTSNLGSGGVWTPVPSPVFTFPVAGKCQWIDDGSLTGGLDVAVRAYRVRLQLPAAP